METEKCTFIPYKSRCGTNNVQPKNLEASGIEVVLTTTMYAVVGAIALQKGGDVAAQVTRDRILKPLGIS